MVAADRGECCEAAGPCCASRHSRGEAFIRNGKEPEAEWSGPSREAGRGTSEAVDCARSFN